MDPTMKGAEATEFPPIPDDQVWCPLRGILVGTTECVDSCVAPEQRPACWGLPHRQLPMLERDDRLPWRD